MMSFASICENTDNELLSSSTDRWLYKPRLNLNSYG